MYTDKFIVYKDAVVNAFQERRKKGDAAWINQLTRFRVRRQCRELVESGLEKRDERTLRRFLEMKPDVNDFLSAINDTEGDDFQGFVNFLEKPAIKTSEENVELLAWLIGFPARPYSKFIEENLTGLEVPDQKQETVVTAGSDPDEVPNGPVDEPVTADDTLPERLPEQRVDNDQKNGKQKTKRYKQLMIGAASVLTVIIIWALIPNEEKCMYWNGDRYVASSCHISRGDTPLVAIDLNKLKNFKKVTHTDTLTRNSIGHLWFTREGDSLEVFTQAGTHPLDHTNQLKALTDYAINFCRNRKNKIGNR